MLRVAQNGKSAGRKRPQRPNGECPGPDKDTVYSRCRDNSAEKYGESQGSKDYKKYTPSVFRASTGDEINGHIAANAVMKRVIGSGEGSTINVLTGYASVTNATLVDMEDGDAGTPIYVRTSKSTAQSVSYTGSPVIGSSGAATTYKYTGTTGGRMNVHTYNGSGGTVENNNYTGAYEVNYNVSTAYQVNLTLYYKKSNGTYAQYPNTCYYGYKKSTLTVTGTDTGSGSAKLVFTPKGETWNSGVVSVTPYTPEVVRAQKIKQGVLTQATTRALNWSYYTYIPSAAETETKTFLMNG